MLVSKFLWLKINVPSICEALSITDSGGHLHWEYPVTVVQYHFAALKTVVHTESIHDGKALLEGYSPILARNPDVCKRELFLIRDSDELNAISIDILWGVTRVGLSLKSTVE